LGQCSQERTLWATPSGEGNEKLCYQCNGNEGYEYGRRFYWDKENTNTSILQDYKPNPEISELLKSMIFLTHFNQKNIDTAESNLLSVIRALTDSFVKHRKKVAQLEKKLTP